VDASFDQIRQAARQNTSVTLRLLETIRAVALQTSDSAFRGALQRQADAIHRASQESPADTTDRDDAEQRYHEAVAALSSGAKSVDVVRPRR
jgi:uncharacterized membrane protein